ncbi:uncharacterized protein LOC128389471 [Panonychus citri]|uniref:uncharacterized protein LOC128389471 n=1 Tax=Panonychus citri TaxID=50023 RepID=UPI00230776BE|nr:uncharacterized protein LOC128389471 [Panonychus citri]
MKAFLVLTALFCVSSINAKHVPGPFLHIVYESLDFVKNIENNLTNWNNSATLQENLVNVVKKSLEPDWSPEVMGSLNDTVNKIVTDALSLFKLPGFKPWKTLEENAGELADNLIYKPLMEIYEKPKV